MGSDKIRLILWGGFGCFGFLVFLLLLKFLSRLEEGRANDVEKAENPRKMRNPRSLVSERSAAVVPTVLRDFSVGVLEKATDNFSGLSLIKIGRSGEFFAGVMEGQEKVVVKRMKMNAEEEEEEGEWRKQVQREVEVHGSQGSDRYVVPLLGLCSQNMMVYKFLQNGDLATALRRGRGVVDDPLACLSLPWITRLKIAYETARALCHLHYDCYPPVVHKDIKSSSILLTEEFEVRLGSLSHIQVAENEALLSNDIFCFGKVLLDLISGLDVSGSQDPYAEAWAKKALPYIDSGYTDSLLALIDPSLVVEEDFTREILGVAALARACLDPNSVKVLTMRDVCQVLHNP
ncbi:hypothetical protein SUGI_0177610 [Cryptomeria japonica]|uniref:probable LRR receptor-like serine/threonine-protein kinase At2g16250 n=1 Tax=Cryptomeria japonica TaxID=3369 RepID=UPI002408D907|nr:probable LRR receptor-like serine/threonine-protein kinase At2g16250 [Cryptomeria japonica]GLJ11810.1 hypothetical protein SUGI_0177610 [Cryptomeria japonica]